MDINIATENTYPVLKSIFKKKGKAL